MIDIPVLSALPGLRVLRVKTPPRPLRLSVLSLPKLPKGENSSFVIRHFPRLFWLANSQ